MNITTLISLVRSDILRTEFVLGFQSMIRGWDLEYMTIFIKYCFVGRESGVGCVGFAVEFESLLNICNNCENQTS